MIDVEAVKAQARLLLTEISFQHAMEFLLSDGIVPASNLPANSILALEDWARRRAAEHAA